MRLAYNEKRDIGDREHRAFKIFSALEWEFPDINNVLDLGCGEGYLVKMLREKGKNAWGIDLREITNQGLIIGDIRSIPFRDESFDFVIDSYTLADMACLQELPETEIIKVLKESRRVLKTGGLLVCYPGCIRMPQGVFGRNLYAEKYPGSFSDVMGHYKKE